MLKLKETKQNKKVGKYKAIQEKEFNILVIVVAFLIVNCVIYQPVFLFGLFCLFMVLQHHAYIHQYVIMYNTYIKL